MAFGITGTGLAAAIAAGTMTAAEAGAVAAAASAAAAGTAAAGAGAAGAAGAGALGAAAAAAPGTAAAAGGGIGALGAGGGTLGTSAGAGIGGASVGGDLLAASPTFGYGAAAAPAAESGGGLLSSLPEMDLPGANPMPSMPQLDPASLFGGSATATPMPAPPPMPAPTTPQPSAPPSTPGVPSSMFSKENLSSAYQALKMGSKLVNNKKDKQTMGLMTLATGLAANGGDLSSPDAMKMFGDSLGDISAGAEQPKPAAPALPSAPRLSQFQAPSTQQPPVSTDRRLSSYFPPSRLI